MRNENIDSHGGIQHSRSATAGPPGTRVIAPAEQIGLPEIVLLASDLFATHSVRVRARQAGIAVRFECASTPEEFLRRVKGTPRIAVCCINGLRQLIASGLLQGADGRDATLEDVAALLAEQGTAMIVVARNSDDEHAILARLQGKIAGALRVAQLDWLPLFIERELREQESRRERENTRREAERMAEVMRESQKLLTVGRLAGEIAHEINNPLEAVTNLLYLMSLDGELGEPNRTYLMTAQRELQRMTVISKQTLNFYRETQTPQRVKISELLDEVLVLFSRKLDGKKITVTRRYEQEDSVLVFPGEMRQIFSNLVANAIDACPHTCRLALRVHPGRKWSDPDVRGLRITIGDSGSGMPENVRRRLGRPFFTTKGQRGTGLGLWVSKAIIERYGGDMQLRSSMVDGRSGTTFSIFLPTNLRPQIVEPPPHGVSSRDRGNMDLHSTDAAPEGEAGLSQARKQPREHQQNGDRTLRFGR